MTASDLRFILLETILGRLMLGGVICSALLLLCGLAMFLAGASHSATAVVLTAGLFVLMATPVLRVGVTVVESVRTRDWFFVSTTIAVVVLLGLTLAHAVGAF
jgi:uncharacterized membrane protein